MSVDAPHVTWDEPAIRAWLAASDEELKVYVSETHMSYLTLYLGRANARHALGEPPDAVLRELWLADRVYVEHGEVFLVKWPPEQLRRRRLLPLELALLVGDPGLLERSSLLFGLDVMSVMAGTETDEVLAEVSGMTSYFQGRGIDDRGGLAGTLAVLYWLALSAVAASSAESLNAVRVVIGRVMADHPHLARPREGGLGRILWLADALGALEHGAEDLLVGALGHHHRLHATELAKRAADDPEVARTGDGALDTAMLAMMTLAAARGLDLGPALAARAGETAFSQALAYAGALGHTATP